jgi:formate C-acetyltransferase
MRKAAKIPDFNTVRDKLERQYGNTVFLPDSGLTKKDLTVKFEKHRLNNPHEPRIITKAWLLNLLCRLARIAPEPDDYFVGKIEHHNILVQLRNQWLTEKRHEQFHNDPREVPGAFIAQLDCSSHICPDWESLLKHGVKGIRDQAAQRSGDYHQAVTLVFDGIINLIRRFDKIQPELGLAALAERPPQTLREALQLAYLYHELVELDGIEVRSMGRFDHIYNDYYVNDLRNGLVTRESAGELLKYFWIKFFAKTMGKRFGKPFTFGPEANELTYKAFEAYHEMHTVDPKFHLRVSPQTPEKLLKLTAKCIQDGCTGIVIVNNDAQVKMLEQNGKSREDAEDYILIGCYEPAVMGKELNCSGAGALNLAKPVEQAVCSGDYPSFDCFFTAYLNALDRNLALQMEKIRSWEKLWPEINPSPLFSGPMASCFERGLDISEAGAEYNTSGICCVGLADAVDSLAVVRQLVYEERRCTMSELRTALAANWRGYEELQREVVCHVPKWGNNDDTIDQLAIKISDFLGRRINREPNARNGVFQAALYGIIVAARALGSVTGALPNGHRAGEALTMNTGATPGRDQNGVTSLINSVTKINLSQFPNGTVLDIMLHPSTVCGREGIDTIIAIIRSHFIQGGMAIQFNIFDRITLRDAKRHPEKYASLQVRVCGWNVRFIDLAPDEQDIFIVKSEVA